MRVAEFLYAFLRQKTLRDMLIIIVWYIDCYNMDMKKAINYIYGGYLVNMNYSCDDNLWVFTFIEIDEFVEKRVNLSKTDWYFVKQTGNKQLATYYISEEDKEYIFILKIVVSM